MRAIFQGCISRTRKGYNMSKKEKTKRINREAALPRLNVLCISADDCYVINLKHYSGFDCRK